MTTALANSDEQRACGSLTWLSCRSGFPGSPGVPSLAFLPRDACETTEPEKNQQDDEHDVKAVDIIKPGFFISLCQMEYGAGIGQNAVFWDIKAFGGALKSSERFS